MIHTAVENAASLAEFISIYIDGANRVATSVDTYLDVHGQTAVFGEHRITMPEKPPVQNDAVMASLFLAMIRRYCRAAFNPQHVTVIVCEPAALAADVSQCHIIRGDTMGHRVHFPILWLAPALMSDVAATGEDFSRKDLLSTLRMQLHQNVGKRDLKAADVAKLAGISLSRLKRALARRDTSISAELDRAKLLFAKSHLAQDALSVAEIAIGLGYAYPSNFTRWCRRTTGQTPGAFRQRQVNEHTSKDR